MPASPPGSSASLHIARRRFATSDGVALNVLEAGQRPDSPVIVFIPGWTMPAWLWTEQLESLSRTFHVAAMDPRGQGESEMPTGRCGIDRRADDIAEVVGAYANVCQRGVVLVAWSLGALEALHCIARHGTGGIAGVVLVDSSLGLDPAPPSSAAFREALARDRGATMRAFVRDLCRKPRPVEEVARLERDAVRMPLQVALDLFPSHLPRERWAGTVEALALPLLYAVTAQFSGQADTLRTRRPQSRVELFESAGHALFLDEPERFSAMLAQFVASLPADK
ncbi:MAG TPA: alpha/beta hydrolase [Burkholderiales bacterium]|nr:alpha/beta hydrolase [Burkholderiales bacterium]